MERQKEEEKVCVRISSSQDYYFIHLDLHNNNDVDNNLNLIDKFLNYNSIKKINFKLDYIDMMFDSFDGISKCEYLSECDLYLLNKNIIYHTMHDDAQFDRESCK